MRRAILCLLLFAFGCSNFSEVVLVVDGDLRTPEDVEQVVVTVVDAAGVSMQTMARVGDNRGQLPKTVSILHNPDERLGPVTVQVQGLLGGNEVIVSRARFTFEKNETKELRIQLPRRCLGVRSCGGETTCGPTGCTSIDIALTEWTGSP